MAAVIEIGTKKKCARRWGMPVMLLELDTNTSWLDPFRRKKTLAWLMSVERSASGCILYEIMTPGDRSSYFYLWDEFEFLKSPPKKVVKL